MVPSEPARCCGWESSPPGDCAVGSIRAVARRTTTPIVAPDRYRTAGGCNLAVRRPRRLVVIRRRDDRPADIGDEPAGATDGDVRTPFGGG